MAAIVASASGAAFSGCRRWRYTLWRRWDGARPTVNFVMLNPSTADEVDLDPSCARAQGYAMRWGYGALIVTNVFAWRATDPRAMKAAADPVGRDNDLAIAAAAREAALVVCAWGNHALHLGRAAQVLELLRAAGKPLHALKVNAGGQPAHPLYLDGRLKPVLLPVPWH
jgi:hypothetical protein